MSDLNFPDDDDGDVLRRIAEGGSDMSAPMEIDFHVDAPDQKRAVAARAALEAAGYACTLYPDAETGRWTVQHTRDMLARHDEIGALQAEIERIVAPHGCAADGWGTFGNAPDEDDEDGSETPRARP